MRTETTTEMSVEGREHPGTYQVIVDVGRKTLERGRCQRVIRSHSRKTRRPSETGASSGGRQSRDGKLETGLKKPREGQSSTRNLSRVIHVMWETGGTCKKNKRIRESVGSVGLERAYLKNSKKQRGKRKAFRALYNESLILPWEDQFE